MQTTVERAPAPPFQLDEEEIQLTGRLSHGKVHDLVDELAEEIAFTLIPGIPVPGLEYATRDVADVLTRFTGEELRDWVAHIERRTNFEQHLTARIAPAACELIVRSIREAWSEQEHVDAVLQLARDFVPRSEDLRTLQASWLTKDDVSPSPPA